MSKEFMQEPAGFADAVDPPMSSEEEAVARVKHLAPNLSTCRSWDRYLAYIMNTRRYRGQSMHFFAAALHDRARALEDPAHEGINNEYYAGVRKATDAGMSNPANARIIVDGLA
jgi:hypothetical protein